jgi:hypothetical protein
VVFAPGTAFLIDGIVCAGAATVIFGFAAVGTGGALVVMLVSFLIFIKESKK